MAAMSKTSAESSCTGSTAQSQPVFGRGLEDHEHQPIKHAREMRRKPKKLAKLQKGSGLQPYSGLGSLIQA